MFFVAFSLTGQDVEISIDHPNRVNAGENFKVTVNIKKGSLTDYSRFSQDLPLGLTATNVNSPNADFSFDEQRVRIIWLKMPETNEISVSYLIAVDSRLTGSFNLGGVFAYVVEDERKFLPLDQTRTITIIPNKAIDPALIVDIGAFREGGTTTRSAVPRGSFFAKAVRQKPELLSNGGYMVRLLIDNPSGSKYAKVEETIPSGYQFEEVNSNEGIVSNPASTVKFIWMKLPTQPQFEVAYRLVPIQNETQGQMYIEGLLTYTDGTENRVEDIVEMNISLENMTSAQKRDLLTNGTVPVATQIPSAVTSENRPSSAPSNVSNASDRFILNTRVLEDATGVYYRVQLTANLTAFDATAFFRDAGLDREVRVEQHDGYYKYTTGPFQSYEQALLYKERIANLQEVEGAFVVGYQNGRRVATSSLR